MKVKRIFHPIGQGAFYSERHDNLNIVYDCGSNTNKTVSNKVVTGAFSKDDVIDILFISHFDSDHVNKISILKKHCKIRKVVLPLLHKQQQNFLTNIYRVLNIGNLTLINNPKKFFGKDTDIIFVSSDNNNNDARLDIEELANGREISSGTGLYVKSMSKWVFVPYNHKYALRNNVLECKLHRKGFCINSLKNNPRYTLGGMEQDVKNSIQEIRKIYQSLPRDGSDTCINENSMFLYSGVEKQYDAEINCTYGAYSFKYSKTPKIGCIYTGDGDLNVVDIKQIYKNYWGFVSTIQIPHHGAEHNFNQNVVTDKYYICPISAANKNKYNHPSSKVIAQIISHNSYPILVSEDPNSEFIEEITI